MKNNKSGFTLLEIMIAVMILAFSLTTLIGLQTSAVTQTLFTQKKYKAMLASRRIMAAIELSPDLLEPMEETGPIKQIEGLFPSLQKLSKDKNDFDDLLVKLKVEKVSINEILPEELQTKEPKLHKIVLTVGWGDSPGSQLTTVYYAPIQ